jgi:hypothetical protein
MISERALTLMAFQEQVNETFWLLALNLLAAILALLVLVGTKRERFSSYLTLFLGLAGTLIAAEPLLQALHTIGQADNAMRGAFGANYELRIPPLERTEMRSTPLSAMKVITGFPQNAAFVAKDLPYRTVDGRALLLDRYDPPGAGIHPGMLMLHGGTWAFGDRGEGKEASRYFAAHGYVVYDAQYRLSSQARFPAQLEDVECALGWALWTGVVVVAVVEIIPAAKERQISRALDAYEAALRKRARGNEDVRPSPDTPS